MVKKFKEIEDILNNSDKAEFLEKLSNQLDIDGCRIVVITGIPNKEKHCLDVEVWQTGFDYLFEEHGFILTGLDIVEGYNDGGNGQ